MKNTNWLVAFILTFILAACGSGEPSVEEKLLGTWEGTAGELPGQLIFGEDGKGAMAIETGLGKVTNELLWSYEDECLYLDDPTKNEQDPGCNTITFLNDNSFQMENSSATTVWIRVEE